MFKKMLVALLLVVSMVGAANANPYIRGYNYGYRTPYGYNRGPYGYNNYYNPYRYGYSPYRYGYGYPGYTGPVYYVPTFVW